MQPHLCSLNDTDQTGIIGRGPQHVKTAGAGRDPEGMRGR